MQKNYAFSMNPACKISLHQTPLIENYEFSLDQVIIRFQTIIISNNPKTFVNHLYFFQEKRNFHYLIVSFIIIGILFIRLLLLYYNQVQLKT